MSSAMGDPEHYRQVHAGASNQVYFGMLARAAVSGRGSASERWTRLARRWRRWARDRARLLHLGALDVAVEMVEAGHVLPVIEAATERWSRHVDPSHLRYFAGEESRRSWAPYGGRLCVGDGEASEGGEPSAGMNRAIDEACGAGDGRRGRG